MDRERFDALSRRLGEALGRRGLLRTGAATVAMTIVAVGAPGLDLEVDAGKRRRKRKRKRKRPCGGQCPFAAPQCCPPTTQDPQGSCAAVDEVCCTSAEGGGVCPADMPTCCPPTTKFEEGFCAVHDATCCPSEQGGFLCPAGLNCCATSDDCPQHATCDQNCCVPNGGTLAKRAPVRDDLRRQNTTG
jgi:hypothetical protein